LLEKTPKKWIERANDRDQVIAEWLNLSVTVREGTTFSVRRVPARNQWVSADWCRPLVSHFFSQELT
jgi:hypothetical protein